MKYKTNLVSWTYFSVHALVELICFAVLYRYFSTNSGLVLLAAILYDILAFIPQGLIGELHQKFRNWNLGAIGAVMMGVGLLLLRPSHSGMTYAGMAVIALGNAFLHEAGAIATTAVCEGKLFPSALFVAGGSFGLIIGQTIGKSQVSLLWMFLIVALILALCILTGKHWLGPEICFPQMHLVQPKAGFWTVLIVAFLVVTVRSFIGYAIPISWKKETWQAFLLFFVMGLGKGAGGWLSDHFGAKKVGVISTLACIPFLLFGRNYMVVSVIGVFLFSMTMSITFGMLLSVIQDDPGLAFGVTTIGLFLGLVPVFVFGSFGELWNGILVAVLSVLCAIGLWKTLK